MVLGGSLLEMTPINVGLAWQVESVLKSIANFVPSGGIKRKPIPTVSNAKATSTLRRCPARRRMNCVNNSGKFRSRVPNFRVLELEVTMRRHRPRVIAIRSCSFAKFVESFATGDAWHDLRDINGILKVCFALLKRDQLLSIKPSKVC